VATEELDETAELDEIDELSVAEADDGVGVL